MPPYTVFADINRMIGLNVIGLRRSPGITEEDRRQIKEAFALTYRSGLPRAKVLEKMDACADWGRRPASSGSSSARSSPPRSPTTALCARCARVAAAAGNRHLP